MSSTEKYSGPKDLVYQVEQDKDRVIFTDRETALYVAQLWKAESSKTWAEFRAMLPTGGLDEFLEYFADEYDDDCNPVDNFPTGDEPFGPHFKEGFPEWLADSMLSWLPKDLIEKYGRHEPYGITSFAADSAGDIIAELRKRGCTVEPSPVFLI